MTDDLLAELSGFLPRLISAVEIRDYDAVVTIYRDVQTDVGVPGGHALTVVLAETLRVEREKHRAQLARLNSELTRTSAAYLDQRRKVGELRGILDARAAASTANRANRGMRSA